MATKVARARETEIPDVWKTLNVAERLSERRVGEFACFSDFLHPLIVRPSDFHLWFMSFVIAGKWEEDTVEELEGLHLGEDEAGKSP